IHVAPQERSRCGHVADARGNNAMPNRTSLVTAVLPLCAIGALSLGARAETPEDRQACSDDVHAHCGEFIPDRDAIVACLKRKLKAISHACRILMATPDKPRAARTHLQR